MVQLPNNQTYYDQKHKKAETCRNMNGSNAKKTQKKILTMKNYVGGESIFSIMSTSHPDGLPPATQPQ